MFKVSTEAYDHRKHSLDVMEVFPTKDCLDKIMLLAKTADVVLYPGRPVRRFGLNYLLNRKTVKQCLNSPRNWG